MAAVGKVVWTGRVISIVASLLFIMSAVMKFVAPPEVIKGFEHLGLPLSMVVPLGILELSCIIIYLIPRTAVLGAILMTGYIGGTIVTHWRVGEAPFTQIVFGILFWVALYLREPRLRELIPLRRPTISRVA